jgi:hypothetical protein
LVAEAEFRNVARAEDIPPGKIRAVKVEGGEVKVAV